jgi:transposase, IS5 family
MLAGRSAHAKQFRRHNRGPRFLRARLGRPVRGTGGAIEGKAALERAFAAPLALARQIRPQKQRQRGWKLYSFHAPETGCIGGANVYRERQALTNGKAGALYASGVKVSIVTTSKRGPGGRFVPHAKAPPGNPP